MRRLGLTAGAVASLLAAHRLPAQLPSPINLDAVGTPSVGGAAFYTAGKDSTVKDHAEGISVAGAGDVNGDGVEDLLIGAPSYPPGSYGTAETWPGAAWLVFGSGISAELAGPIILPEVDLRRAIRLEGQGDRREAGRSVSGVGDVNGDGFSDFAIGARDEAYIIYGPAAGSSQAGARQLASLTEVEGTRLTAPAASLEHSGLDGYWQVSGAGDVNGDGFDDIIVGVSARKLNVTNFALLIYGSETGIGQAGSLDVTRLHGPDGVSLPSPTLDEGLGDSVDGVGDVNGDGLDDILVGAPLTDSDVGFSAGSAYLVYGSPDEMGVGGVLALSSLDGTLGVVIVAADGNDNAGANVAGAGDVNNDGLADFLVTANLLGEGPDFHGLTVLLWGSADAIGVDGLLPLAGIGPGVGVRMEGSTWSNGNLGQGLASAGDVSGDGRSDVLIGQSFTVPGDRCLLVYGAGERWATAGELDLSTLDGVTGVRLTSVDSPAGGSVSGVGDVNGDGLADFAIGGSPYGFFPEDNSPYPFSDAQLLFGAGASPEATYRCYTRAGDTPRRGVGMIGDGSHSIPFSRCWIDYGGGSGPGPDGSSLETVTLTRSAASVENLASPEAVARVVWAVSTDRAGYGSARLTFHYVSSEITGLEELDLRLFHAPSPSGPWTPALPMALSTRRNEITGTVAVLGSPEHFALAATGGSLGVETEAIIRALLGLDAEDEVLDVNGDHRVDVGDVAFNLNAL